MQIRTFSLPLYQMRQMAGAIAFALLLCGLANAQAPSKQSMPSHAHNLFASDNLIAWCIVPFDKLERGPADRVAMLKQLGFRQYAWDWREKHLADLQTEIALARENDIQIRAVWLWIDRDTDKVGAISPGNRRVMRTIEDAGISVEFWLGFNENFFEGLTEKQRVDQGAAMVSFLADEAKNSNSSIALYNHGGWFGETRNQIAIIQKVGEPSVGMVYNFHHAHHEIDRFPENLELMLPYLKAVSINGMNPDGPKILPVGSGVDEQKMLNVLQDSEYRGPIAILGHDETRDVAQVLRENLQGLQTLTR